MTTRLKPENRALFEAGRRGLAPTDDDRARVARTLGLNLGVGGGTASAAGKVVDVADGHRFVGNRRREVGRVVAVVVGAGTGVALHQAERARSSAAGSARSCGRRVGA